MSYCRKERRFGVALAWFFLVGGGILFSGCDSVLELLEAGGDEPSEGGTEKEIVTDSESMAVFKTYYVKYNDTDNNGAGTLEDPAKTVEVALELMAADFASAAWPGKEGPDVEAGKIIILGEITVTQTICIDSNHGYPPIILRGGSGSGNKLVWGPNATGDYLLNIKNSAKVILEKDLTLTRATTNRALVYVGEGSTFIMNAGEIAGGGEQFRGRGVFVENGVFIMNGGDIKDNVYTNYTESHETDGAGVCVRGGSFTMHGGNITNNSTADDFKSSLSEFQGHGGGVAVENEGSFSMNGGSIAKNYSANGGGVYLNYGSFSMNGGTIEQNTGLIGGGVFLCIGEFTMWEPGKITRNKASAGGGVSVQAGGWPTTPSPEVIGATKFIMYGGEITHNEVTALGKAPGSTAANNNTYAYIILTGGGVSVGAAIGSGGTQTGKGTFIMEGGKIAYNKIIDDSVYTEGGGVYVGAFCRFFMKGGSIEENDSKHGAGVCAYSAQFEMSGGTIASNRAGDSGGGVLVYSYSLGPSVNDEQAFGMYYGITGVERKFTMSGGTIASNRADGSGGGVSLYPWRSSGLEAMSRPILSGRLVKDGGTIYGNDATPATMNNSAGGSGHAIYLSEGKKRNSTLGASVLDTNQDSTLWE